MGRILLFTRARAWLIPILGWGIVCVSQAAFGDNPKPGILTTTLQPELSTCSKFGTSVEFVSSPSEAARKAKQEEKLVFVLHVSGHFEDPRFT